MSSAGIFGTGTPRGKYQLDSARFADGSFRPGHGPSSLVPTRGNFVTGGGFQQMRGDYIAPNPDFGIVGPRPWRRQGAALSGLGAAPASSRNANCTSLCASEFAAEGRQGKCYAACASAANAGACWTQCKNQFDTNGRRTRCQQVCMASFDPLQADALTQTNLRPSDEGAPGGAPMQAGIMGALLPILAVGTAVSIGVWAYRKYKRGRAS